MCPRWNHDFCLKMNKQKLWKACQTSEWKCPLCKSCWRYTIAKLIQECWYNKSKYCITSPETHFMLYSMKRFVDIMIMAFSGGIESSHGHVLLKMRYKATLIAIIGLVKPCVAGIECWIPAARSEVQRSATSLFERWLQPKIWQVHRSITNLWSSEGKF